MGGFVGCICLIDDLMYGCVNGWVSELYFNK